MLDRPIEYEKMYASEMSLWWYAHLHELVLATFKTAGFAFQTAILDAGCGTGGLLTRLHHAGYENTLGIDLSPHAVRFCRQRNLLVTEGSLWDAVQLKEEMKAEVVICNDALYFLRDAREQFEWIRAMGQETLLIMNLPALKAYAGMHDLAVGIDCRFDRRSVVDMATRAGLAVVTARYWPFLLSIPILFVRAAQRRKMKKNVDQRIVSDVRVPNWFLNKALYHFVKVEQSLFAWTPFGSSLFVVLEGRTGSGAFEGNS